MHRFVRLPRTFPVDFPDLSMPELERVKDTFMVCRLGKNRRNGGSVVLIQVRHDDLGAVAFRLQRQQKRLRARRTHMWKDGDVQQIIGVRINGDVDVQPISPTMTRHRHLHPLFINPDDATALHDPEQRGDQEKLSSKLTDPMDASVVHAFPVATQGVQELIAPRQGPRQFPTSPQANLLTERQDLVQVTLLRHRRSGSGIQLGLEVVNLGKKLGHQPAILGAQRFRAELEACLEHPPGGQQAALLADLGNGGDAQRE